MPIIDRKLRYGMIGGGPGAFIGAVHRIAAQMDGQAELVAGAFSSDPERSQRAGADLFLPPERIYPNYTAMAQRERGKPPSERLDFVIIVTPNHLHFPVSKTFLEAGFNVICDKPLTVSLDEANALEQSVRQSKKLFVLTHHYAGNAMVKQARDLVRAGTLGGIRKIVVEYSQGWLSKALETAGNKQATWRTDPQRAGLAGSVGDIGTHAEHLARYVTGLHIESLCADLTAFVKGRKLDDDANILTRYQGGAKGILHCSQIAIGEENNLNLRVYGTHASLEWHQEEPNHLILNHADKPSTIFRRGNDYDSPEAKRVTRIPPGHPEGYLEAFANLYQEAFRAIRAELNAAPIPNDLDLPTVQDGVEGMRFIQAAVKSANADAQWVNLP